VSDNRKVMGILVGGVLLGGAIGGGVGLKLGKNGGSILSGNSTASCAIPGASSTDGSLFEIDGTVITPESLPSDARDTLFQIQSQSHETASNFLKEIAVRISLAKAAGKPVDTALPALKDLIPNSTVTEAEMKDFFEKNKNSIPPGTKYEQIKPQLQQFLTSQKVGQAAQAKIAELQNSKSFKLLLVPPIAPIVNLDTAPFPQRGSKDSKVTVVEVSDYLCPHCRTVKPEVEKLLADYGSKIKFVQVNYSLNPRELSGALARGGFCAQKQGEEKFWKYHDKAFAVNLEAAKAVSPNAELEFNAHAVTAAKESGVDEKAFGECLSSAEASEFVENTNKKMMGLGVNGTPTFFINNRKVSLGSTRLADAVQKALE
jgi:protein-disulfide isomerase